LGGWLLFNVNSSIFQLFQGENKLIFSEMMMRPALYSTNMLTWILIVLAHWNNSPWIDMSPYSDTISWFPAKQSLLFLLNDSCLGEMKQTPFHSLCLTWSGLEPSIYRTRGDHVNHYTADEVIYNVGKKYQYTYLLPIAYINPLSLPLWNLQTFLRSIYYQHA
jgi:hypothetical protein